jgi:hypothetical protein
MLVKFKEQVKNKSQGSSQTNSTAAFGGQFGGFGSTSQATASDMTIDVSTAHIYVDY